MVGSGRRSRWRRASTYVAVAVAAIVLGGAWLGWRGLQIERHLSKARATVNLLIPAVRAEVAGGPAVDLTAQTHQVGADAAAAHAAAHDPLWALAAHIPWLGRPFRQAQALADASDRLGRSTVPDVITAAADLRPLRGSQPGQAVPLAAVARAAGPTGAAVAGLDASLKTVEHSPSSSVIASLNRARASLLTQMTSLSRSIASLNTVAQLVPPMLGGSGTRTYLVVFENPAEARGSGGVFAGYALVTADGGRVQVTRIGSNDLPNLTFPAAGLDSQFASEFPEFGVGETWLESNVSPDFPTAGGTWAAMYKQVFGGQIDGVLGVDPEAMATMLSGTSPVSVQVPGLAPISLSASNIVTFLERDEYKLLIDETQRKALLVDVGRQVLGRLFTTQMHAADLVKQLANSADGGHLRLMSTHPAEQAALVPWPVGGAMPTRTRPFAELVLNNASGTKLDYYLTTSLTYQRFCADPSRTEVVATIVNTAPPAGLPAFVTTPVIEPGWGQPVGETRDTIAIYAAGGSRFVSATFNGSPIGIDPTQVGSSVGVYLRPGSEEGHPFWFTDLELAPGQSAVLAMQMATAAGNQTPTLPSQPLPNPTRTSYMASCR